jgi:hypothetical protein
MKSSRRHCAFDGLTKVKRFFNVPSHRLAFFLFLDPLHVRGGCSVEQWIKIQRRGQFV